MTQSNNSSNHQLPSVGKLIKSTILAIVLAAVILVTVVLPAEYGIDPTGIGDLIGLKRMGEIKASLSEEVEKERSMAQTANSQPAEDTGPLPGDSIPASPETGQVDTRADTMTVDLTPNEGKEIKLTMAAGRTVTFSWWTDGGKANYDSHADSKELEIKYHNYSKGAEARSEGVLEAAFNGNHGWFWRNRTSENMVVTLQVSGEYTDIVRPN